MSSPGFFFFACMSGGGEGATTVVVLLLLVIARCINANTNTLIFFFFRVSQDEVSTFLQRINSVEIFEVREFSFLDEMNLHFLTNMLYVFASAQKVGQFSSFE